MTRSTAWIASAVVALSVLASPALAQTTSGSSDTSAPGPNNILQSSAPSLVNGVYYIPLQWVQPFNNTSNNDGTGTGSGPLAVSCELFYRTDQAITTAALISGATFVPGTPAVAGTPGVTVASYSFQAPADGVTYYFALRIKDAVNTTISLGTTQACAALGGGGGGGSDGGGGGSGCVASPVSWLSTFASTALGKLSEGASLVVLAGCLVLVGISLRRPS